MNFGERLHLLRKSRGLSQAQLASEIEVSRQAIQKYEAGETFPEIGNLILLSDFFMVSIDQLVKNYESNCFKEENQKEVMMSEEAKSFLVRAKQNTYCAQNHQMKSTRPESFDYLYEDGSYKYIDTYLGGEKFTGEEALYIQNKPVYAMNYSGRVLDTNFKGEFLHEVLKNVSVKNPYRGPEIYQNGDYLYHMRVSGDMGWFQGYEDIYYKDIKVYELFFHGGMVK